jgi:hypothetical protein
MIPSRRPIFSDPGSRKYMRAEPVHKTNTVMSHRLSNNGGGGRERRV